MCEFPSLSHSLLLWYYALLYTYLKTLTLYDNIHNIETEFGVKIEKTFFHDTSLAMSKIYIKPSIIQNFGKGNVNITSLNSMEGVENQTLIRGELGGSFNFGNGWSGFGSAGYTFGSDYKATDFNLGINYNW